MYNWETKISKFVDKEGHPAIFLLSYKGKYIYYLFGQVQLDGVVTVSFILGIAEDQRIQKEAQNVASSAGRSSTF